jgi:hypothetical protein
MKRSLRRVAVPVCLSGLLGLAGCSSSDVDYSLLPDIVRIVTDPPGADLQLEGYPNRFLTPCDIKRETLRGRTIKIVKDGFVPFEGSLAEIPAGERGSFRLVLRKQ